MPFFCHNIILLYKQVYSVFNLKFHIELSTRPEDKYIGEISTWDKAEKALADVGDKVDASEKATVEADIQALKDILAKSTPETMTDADVEEIKAAKEKLMTDAQGVFTKMYENIAAQQQGTQGGPTPEAGPAPEGFNGDDVVDGDYKEI